ncbi:Cucumber peeling cupredoxin [Nymphaea thermarum]|nr:Cucumber peeling cupredoxin [Nymphaea thermarum]
MLLRMDRNCRTALCLLLPLVFLTSSTAQAYKNYTVGDDLGWYDNTENSKINYQKWAAGKNFSLGDFLIFNTNTNHSVVQTYNFTIYKRCDFNDADSRDTTEYSSQGDYNQAAGSWSIAIPLKKEGVNYLFSSFYDGDQCKNGQRFRINVIHGQGLPDSLKNPVDASSPSPQPQQDDDTSTPDTANIPGNFNKPVPSSSEDVKQASGASASSIKSTALGVILLGILGIWVC